MIRFTLTVQLPSPHESVTTYTGECEGIKAIRDVCEKATDGLWKEFEPGDKGILALTRVNWKTVRTSEKKVACANDAQAAD